MSPSFRPLLAGIVVAAPLLAQAQVVINEIFYHGPGDLDRLQYVEIHNASPAAVDLAGWSFTRGLQFTFPAGSRLDPGGFAVVAQDADLFRKHYPAPLAGAFRSRLKRKGELLELRDAAGRRVDAVTFSDRAPWAAGADGHSGSLERISPAAAGDDPANWMASPLSGDREKPTGTPGRTNTAFSATLPPVIAAVRSTPAWPSPGQAVTVEADLRPGPPAATVNLRYRLAGPGFEREEMVLPMPAQSPGRFAAQLPGQPAGSLVRFRVEAVGADGSRRFFPAPTEPRPALSTYVTGPVAAARVPVACVLHTTPREMQAAREREQAPVFGEFRAPRPDPGREAREEARRMLESRLDLSPLWFELTARPATDPAALEQWRTWMQERLASRRQWMESRLADGDVAARRDGLATAAAEFLDQTLEQAASRLPEAGRPALRAWAKARLERWEAGERLVATRVDLEGAWHALTLGAEPDPARLPALLAAVRELDRQRSALVAEVLAGNGRNRAFRDQRDRADELGGTVGRLLQPLASPAQAEALETWQKSPREVVVGLREPPRGRPGGPGGLFGPGGPGFFGGPLGGPPAEPGSFQSAFVYFDPATGRTRLFDFVQITGRKGGRKVHLPAEDPLDGMTTFALIFEGSTAALVEPLAYEVYRRAGMPVPQSRHVRLWQDGRLAGYTVLVEQPNRAFLRRHRINDDGTMYKLLWYGGDLIGQHEKHTRRNEGHEDLVRLMEGLEKSSGAARTEYLRKNFDVDEVAAYFAVNMVLSHWDGFFNNYFTYHDSAGTGKWLMFPWDQDSTWGLRGGFGRGEGVYFNMALTFGMTGDTPPEDGGGTWRPPGFFSGPLLADPEFRRVFLRRTRDLLENVCTEAGFGPVLDDLEARLTPEVRLRAEAGGEDPAEAVDRFKSDLARCRQHLRLRRDFLLAQPELKQLPR
ncbi:MAG: CotH kinase family protein [Verrucomicrobiota bacterium]